MKTLSSFFRCGLLGTVLVGLAIVFGGCSTCKPGGGPGKPLAYNLHVNLSPTLKESSVVVDVIPANEYDLERLRTYSINKYWEAADPMREDLAKVSFSFVSGNDLNCEIKAADPRWQKWIKSGAQYLVVIADLPGVYQDQPGSQDPRRQILPICKCYWPSGTKDLMVAVQTSGVRVVTAPRLGQSLPPGW
jgi:hypothetical protein